MVYLLLYMREIYCYVLGNFNVCLFIIICINDDDVISDIIVIVIFVILFFILFILEFRK